MHGMSVTYKNVSCGDEKPIAPSKWSRFISMRTWLRIYPLAINAYFVDLTQQSNGICTAKHPMNLMDQCAPLILGARSQCSHPYSWMMWLAWWWFVCGVAYNIYILAFYIHIYVYIYIYIANLYSLHVLLIKHKLLDAWYNQLPHAFQLTILIAAG